MAMTGLCDLSGDPFAGRRKSDPDFRSSNLILIRFPDNQTNGFFIMDIRPVGFPAAPVFFFDGPADKD